MEKKCEERNIEINVKKDLVRNGKRRKIGYIELASGIFFLAAAIWLFGNTLGTRLLYADVWVGKISRYYWIVFLFALVLLLLGSWQIRRNFRGEKNRILNGTEDREKSKREMLVKPDIQLINCSQCGKLNDAEDKFCIFCGNKMS